MNDINYLLKHGYSLDSTIIQWPESQMIMDEPWFEECELINDDIGLQMYGSSAYVVPLEHVINLDDE